MTETVEKTNELPAITPDAAKQKLSIALTKATFSVQGLQNEADALIFNEDQENLEKIAAFLAKTKKITKVIDDEHKVIKEPYLEGGRSCDTAKKDMTKSVVDVSDPVRVKYTTLCDKIDRDNKEKERLAEAKKKIEEGIEANVLQFSQQIAACTTRKQLNDIERLINLEKSPSRASKYGDLHQKCIDRYDEVLIPVLKDQKNKLDEQEALQKELDGATDPEKHDEIKEKLEAKQNEITQNQILVQEQALSQPTMSVIEPEVVTTEVKAKRTEMVCEIVDLALVFKKSPELLNIDLKLADAKKLGNTLKEAGAFGTKDELIVNGLKYTIKKVW